MDELESLASRDELEAPEAQDRLEALNSWDELEGLGARLEFLEVWDEPEPLEAQDVDEESIDARNELLSDLRGLVNKAEWSDVVLKCGDGIDVHACRGLLAVRCAVFQSMFKSCAAFQSMFKSGMLEPKLSELSFPNISSRAMLCVVEFLYTSSIDSHSVVDWKMGFELISAAQYFDIRILGVMARDFLRRQLLQVDSASQKPILMDMLSVALECPEMWDGKDELLVSLVNQIGDDWFEERSSHKLSASALDYILSFRKRGCGKGKKLSMDEYFTFRKIVLWAVCQGVPESNAEAREAVQKVLQLLPGKDSVSHLNKLLAIPTDIDHYTADASKAMTSCDTTAVLNSISKSKICKKSLKQLLGHINLELIPPSLLLNVIYPLEMIPPRDLLAAFIRQALQRNVRIHYSLPAIDWKHGNFCAKVGVEGQILAIGMPRVMHGSAIALIRTPKSSNSYEWIFEILDDKADYIELGFVYDLGNAVNADKVTAGNLWDRSSSRILCVSRRDGKTYVSKQNPQGCWKDWESFKTEVKVNSVVNFKLNRSTKTCQVMFGDSCGAMWEDLPDGEFHPAVGFSSCRSVRVQLRLGDGFHFFP